MTWLVRARSMLRRGGAVVSAAAPALAGFAILGLAAPLWAATFTVTKTADTRDGSCDADCSLREAVIAANLAAGADTITLPAGSYAITLAGDDGLAATGDLDVTGDLLVSGAGAGTTLVDGGALDRVFEIDPASSGISVELSGITVKGGLAILGGGILNNATLTLTSCIVSGNDAEGGGGIHNSGTLTLTGTTVTGNDAVISADPNSGFGGGIFNGAGASVSLSGSTVSSNTSGRDGGGIFAGAGAGLVSIVGSSLLSGNMAGGFGGGVVVSGMLSVVDSTVSGNTGSDGGGIASLSGGDTQVTNSTVQSNTASATDLGGGGGVFNFGGTLNIAGSMILDNQAFGEGGGGLENAGVATVSSTTFRNNTAVFHNTPLPDSAPGLGGAILTIAGSTTTLNAVTLELNTAGNSGGAIYNDQNATTFVNTGSLLHDNDAERLFGGAILNEGTITVTGSTLSSNDAAQLGGALSNSLGQATLQGSVVTTNTAGINGAGLYNGPGGTLTLTSTQVTSNIASGAGGGLQNEASATATGCTLDLNQSTAAGAGVFNATGATLTLTDCSVSTNTSSNNGGGIANAGTLDTLRTTIASNNAVLGGGIVNLSGQVTLTGSTLAGNTASSGGGGVFSVGASPNLATLTLVASTVSGNTSSGSFGGGIQNDLDSSTSLTNSTLHGNSTAATGGGIANTHATGVVSILNTTLTDNTAPSGDALLNFQGSTTLTNSLVVGACENSGGTLTSSGGNLESPGTSCGFVQAGDQDGVSDPGLAALADNGGPTLTRLLLAGSPAIDAALSGPCPADDQIGSARPADGDGDTNADCDVGAVELPEPGATAGLVAALGMLGLLRVRHGAPR